ncbi:MAG: type transporter [Frankiales bacterium]|nr:type transporter [Frankiales bacterium]
MTATTPEFAMRHGAAASWQRIRTIGWRHAVVLLRSPHRYFDVALWPAVDTLLFGAIGAFFARNSDVAGGTALRYLLIGVVLWHVVYQAQISLSTGFMEETWSRNVLSLAVTPLAPWEYIAGVVLFGLVKMVVGVGGVVVIAVAAYGLDLGTITVGIVPIVMLLLICGYAIAFGVIGLMLRYGSGAEAFAWGILFVVMPLSGVFYPVTALPGVIQPLSNLLPTTYLFSAGRTLTETGSLPAHTMVLALISTVAAAVLAVAYCMWMMRLFRQRGYITRWS